MRIELRPAAAGLALCLAMSGGLAEAGMAEEAVRPKSEAKALRWSVLGTAVPVALGVGALVVNPRKYYPPAGPGGYGYYKSRIPAGVSILTIVGGAVIGPSLGHFYAGRPGRGAVGVLGRSGGVGIAFVSLIVLAGDETNDTVKPTAVLFVSLAAVAAYSAFDIATAPRSARKWNEAHAPVRVGVSPVLAPGGAPGVALHVGF